MQTRQSRHRQHIDIWLALFIICLSGNTIAFKAAAQTHNTIFCIFDTDFHMKEEIWKNSSADKLRCIQTSTIRIEQQLIYAELKQIQASGVIIIAEHSHSLTLNCHYNLHWCCLLWLCDLNLSREE